MFESLTFLCVTMTLKDALFQVIYLFSAYLFHFIFLFYFCSFFLMGDSVVFQGVEIVSLGVFFLFGCQQPAMSE